MPDGSDWAAACQLEYPSWTSSAPIGDQGLLVILAIVLAQRVALETLVEQDRSQVGVAAKDDAVHVMALTFHEMRRAVERHQGVHHRLRLGNAGLQSNAHAVARGIEVINDVKARRSLWPVDCGDIEE